MQEIQNGGKILLRFLRRRMNAIAQFAARATLRDRRRPGIQKGHEVKSAVGARAVNGASARKKRRNRADRGTPKDSHVQIIYNIGDAVRELRRTGAS